MSDDAFRFDEARPSGTAARAAPKRPHGGALLVLGWTLMTIGGLAFVIGLLLPSMTTLYLGAALINVGFVVAALGLIVRALFFLPGRTVAAVELYGESARVGPTPPVEFRPGELPTAPVVGGASAARANDGASV